MSLAILETGAPPGDLAATYGDYPAMFRALLGREARSYNVELGQFPDDPGAHDAWLITGSPAGVYEDLPWIAALITFLRRAKGRAKLVGVCFGHQVMAQAFGGHVEKSAKGWGAGLMSYPIVARQQWMDDAPLVAVPASHQDQVVVQPPHTEIVASSLFTPYAALAWTDQPAISFQFHPEFSPAFASALIEQRYDRVPDPAAAIASLDAPNDNQRVGQWINRFLSGPESV